VQIKQALIIAAEKCQNSSTPNLDARVILCKVLSLSYEQLLIKYNDLLSALEEEQFFSLLERRVSMEPIAYIVGKQEFYGRDFIVDKSVLIPRPETELLVDSIIEDYNARHLGNDIKILELGTGSGAISVTIANEILMADILAVDISQEALNVAKINAHKHNVSRQMKFIQSDWFSNIPECRYDYIVSNPPYIAYHEKSCVVSSSTILFEPDLALYANDDGLSAYKAIINSASTYLKPGGKLFFEIGYNQRDKVLDILKEYDFTDVVTKRDMSGHNRVLIAKQYFSEI
jgi:release factor glutamine methyltransferase